MKNKMQGFKDIFIFTVVQSFKAKSMKIAMTVLCVIALVSVPIICLIDSQDEVKTETSIKKVKVVDLTGFNLIEDLPALKNEQLYDSDVMDKNIYSDIEYEVADIDYSKFLEDAKLRDIYVFDKDADYVYMQLTYIEDSFDTQIIYSNETEVEDSDVSDYTDFINEYFKKIIIKNAELTDEQRQIVDSTQVITYQKDLEEDSASDDNRDENRTAKNLIITIVLTIVMFALAFGGERVAMSIVTEKASKVMEYLMTSVKPMALVVGKILANITILFIQAALIGISFVISILLNGMMFSKGGSVFEMPDFMRGIFKTSNFSGLTVYNVIFAVIIIVMGFILYGLIAGLAGASVSKMEEVAEGVKMYSILLVISAYAAMFVVGQNLYLETSAIKYIIMFIPFTSIFIVPPALLTGYVTAVEALIAIAIMCVGVLLMIKFVASVYEGMIYYSGSPLKLKDIINISKQNSISEVSANGKEEDK